MSTGKTTIDAASADTFAAALDQIVTDERVRDGLEQDPDQTLAELGLERKRGLGVRSDVRAGSGADKPTPAFAPPFVPVSPT